MIAEIFGITGAVSALALAALGSVLGTSSSGLAAIGAWKKSFASNKEAPFILIAFVGAPLTQTIYGFILMTNILNALHTLPAGVSTVNSVLLMLAGVLGGAAIGASSLLQGRVAAAAADALGETGRGFGNFIMVLGIIETVGLFTMVFLMIPIGQMG